VLEEKKRRIILPCRKTVPGKEGEEIHVPLVWSQWLLSRNSKGTDLYSLEGELENRKTHAVGVPTARGEGHLNKWGRSSISEGKRDHIQK